MRNEEHFDAFWEKLLSMMSKVDVGELVLPRKRKAPKYYEEGMAPLEYDSTAKNMYRRKYYKSLDLLTQAIDTRFD